MARNYVPSTWNRPMQKEMCRMWTLISMAPLVEIRFQMHKQVLQRKVAVKNAKMVRIMWKTTTRP
jgi:hypothetical protein